MSAKYRKTKDDKVVWNKQMDLELVEFMFPKRHVWDCRHRDYVRTNLKKRTFGEFALKYNDEITGSSVKHRWRNIRSVFARNLRKIKRLKRATGKTYNPTWHLWKACQYLMDQYTKQNTNAGIDPVEIKIETPTEADNLLFLDDSFDNTTSPSDSIFHEDPIQVETLNITSMNGISDSNEKTMKTEENNLVVSCEKALGNLSNVLNPMLTLDSVNKDHKTSSEFQHIGKFVTQRLCKMRAFDAECASKKIMNVLVLYNKLNPNNPNSILQI